MALRRASRVLGGVASAVILAACTLLHPLGDYAGAPRADATPEDAASDAAAPPGCALAHVPPPPEPASGVGAPLSFSLRQFAFGGPDDGLDLDDRCSACAPSERRTCLNDFGGVDRCVADGLEGRDNAAGAYARALVAPAAADVVESMRIGAYGLLVRVDGWTTDEEDRVGVELLTSTQGLELVDGGRPPRTDDGNDRWSIDRATADGRRATVAYVIKNTLYAQFTDVSFHVGKFAFTFTEATLQAELGRDSSGRWALTRGTLSGRSPTRAFLANLQRFTRSGGVCEPTLAEAFRTELCALADVMDRPSDDGSEQRCSAVSLTLRFTAGEAREGVVVDADAGLFPCGPDFMGTCF